MLDYQVICEFNDLERKVEETTTLAFASLNDLETEVESQAMLTGARYNIMPRRRGKHRWEIREPGELLVVIKGVKIFE
jgi:hypothetical protein